MLNGYGNFKKVYVMVSDILIKEQNDTSNPTPQQLSNGWKKKKEIGEKCLILTYMPVGTKVLILIVIF